MDLAAVDEASEAGQVYWHHVLEACHAICGYFCSKCGGTLLYAG